MTELIGLFNLERAAADKAPIRIGIGIATGELIAGYTGTQARATYTCVGSVVNRAARLEAQNKATGRTILMDEATCRGAALDALVEPLGALSLAGLAAPVEAFAVGRG